VAAGLRRGQTIYEREQAERAYARWGVERRSPLDDRRVLELALGMPDDVRRRGLATKWALRRASEGLVPDSVRHRGWKTGFGDVLLEELHGLGGPEALADLAIADLGWVDPGVLRQAWEAGATTPERRPPYSLLWAIWNTLWTDRWYRATVCA
jgi:asparagine synthase (glutamine-hydrolysing)